MIPIKSPNVKSTSATKPSIWKNSAKCVASSASLRNTRSMEKYFFGENTPDAYEEEEDDDDNEEEAEASKKNKKTFVS